MSARQVLGVSALTLFALAHAADEKGQGRYLATPLKGDYYVYGGTISEKLPPTPKDRKVSFMFTGQLAKDLFNQIGPDEKKLATRSLGIMKDARATSVAYSTTTATVAILASM